MHVATIGTGYVGLVTGTCLADVGHKVICMDRDEAKIARLRRGEIPIYEEGLTELVTQNVADGRLRFTTRLEEALAEAEVVFLAIGTPPLPDGRADLSMIFGAAEQIGAVMQRPLIIVQKSTCPVGTAAEIERRVAGALAARGVEIPFAVAVNPEFLREGVAVHDFMHPDRVVIGATQPEVAEKVAAVYTPLAPSEQIFLMDRPSAEMTKYAANAFLATKISFINEVANLCEAVGADVEAVRRGIGSDKRIGPAFLAAGLGYGGSCFPKDVKALMKTGLDQGYELQILQAVEAVNQVQRSRQVEKVVSHFAAADSQTVLAGKRIAVWGLAFKPGTDDMREAPSLEVIAQLLSQGAEVVAYDPIAMPHAARLLDSRVSYATDALTCLDNADALVLLTEWEEFLSISLADAGGRMANRVLFDFRNAFNPAAADAAGFTYYGVGRVAVPQRHAVVGKQC